MAIIKVNGIELYYESHGEGEPLLLLSGFGADHGAWSGILSQLIKQYRVILVDNRGAGQSGCPDYPYTIKMMAEDVAALCDSLSLAQLHFLGSSMGGCIVQTLAYHYPKLVKSAVIANSFMKVDARRKLFYQAQQELLEAGAPADALVKDKLCWVYSNHYLEKPGRAQRLVKQWQQSAYPFTLTGYHNQVSAIFAFDSTPWIEQLAVPCLVIGCDDDLISLETSTREMAQRIPGAEYLCFNNTGHLPYLERPQEFLLALTKFINRFH